METMIICAIASIVCIYLGIKQIIDIRRYKHEEELNDAFTSGYEWGKIAECENVIHVDAVLIEE